MQQTGGGVVSLAIEVVVVRWVMKERRGEEVQRVFTFGAFLAHAFIVDYVFAPSNAARWGWFSGGVGGVFGS
jgi:hypothetical protein